MPSYKQKKQRIRQLIKQEQSQRIRIIQQKGHNFIDTDIFKREEKHYKNYLHLQTDYSKIVKLQNCRSFKIDNYHIYEFQEPKGAFIIKNFVDKQTQFQVGYEALNQFIFRPYRTNLDGTNGLYHQNAQKQKNLQLFKQHQSKNQKFIDQTKFEGTQQKIIVQQIQNQKIVEEIDYQDKNLPYYFNQKIRMSNLGYQYDWPHRSYPATKVPIPTTVTNLTSRAKQIYSKIKKSQLEYHGQAVIVNYYKLRDYMTGHLDDGQQDQINPIFSFCFGLSCVFLLGGTTRDKEPIAIRLDAGDLLIMSGESRICYHGVPRIIEDSYCQEGNKLIQNKFNHENYNNNQNDNQNKYQNNYNNIKYNIIGEQLQKIKQQINKQIKCKKSNTQIQNIEKRYLNGFDEILNYFKDHRLNINVRQVWVRKDQQQNQIKSLINN